MFRASTSEALRRRKVAAALAGGGTAVVAITTIGFFAASGGLDRFVLNGGEESVGQSSPKDLRNGAIPSLRPSLDGPSQQTSSDPTSTVVPSGSSSITPTPTISVSSPPSLRPSISLNPMFTETEKPSGAPIATESNLPTNGQGVPASLEPTEYPTETESNFPTNGSGVQPSLEPIGYPTATKSIFPTNVSEFPSTRSLLTNATNATNVPTTTPTISSNPTDEFSKGTFRIRMHWQPGYLWQESPEEGWFCLACAQCDLKNEFFGLKRCDIEKSCSEHMHIALTGCDPINLGPSKMMEIATFKFLFDEAAGDGLDGDQIQVLGTNLCIQQVLPGGTGSIELRQCDSSLMEQRFWGARPVGQAMELLPLQGNLSKCLSNHHHPRQEEQVYAEDCHLARLPDTSLWCPFSPEHDTIGTCSVVTASPTNKPTRMPMTSKPSTARPTRFPTVPPTSKPTKYPSVPPTSRPTKLPRVPPTSRPTRLPTVPPTARPTRLRTATPISWLAKSTNAPTAQAEPTTTLPAHLFN
ncbi:hypothetical protein ACHAXA_010256 [Cyclostephanos tholiformis]|uniref:Ricin B lectin domain-containing protein n=1 Tax=Cyclostephanos tholiformis TaxID=382380 RepID=A0ABD3RTY2_9STRA